MTAPNPVSLPLERKPSVAPESINGRKILATGLLVCPHEGQVDLAYEGIPGHRGMRLTFENPPGVSPNYHEQMTPDGVNQITLVNVRNASMVVDIDASTGQSMVLYGVLTDVDENVRLLTWSLVLGKREE